MKRLLLLAVCMAATSAIFAGCSLISGEPKIDEGIVIAPKLKIRSTTAMVALDIAEVKRGDRLEILEQSEVRTPTRTDEWYKVRLKDNEDIVGWVEARYVVNRPVVDKIEQLFEGAKSTPSQGKGRLKVQTKLRLDPGGDVVTNLSRGTPVEIVGKARTTIKPEKQQGTEDTDETTEEPEARTVLWYQVRLPDSDVLRAGWVGAQQVQLDVPDEILHLEGDGRRFTGWVVFDQTKDRSGNLKENYIGLMKSVTTEGPIDFTRIWVLVYSPSEGRYINGFLQDNLRGLLPVTLGTSSGGKGFTIHELDENGNSVPAEYSLSRVNPTRLEVKRLTPLRQIKKQPRKSSR